MSEGKQHGNQRSNSSAHEKRKTAGQTISMEPSPMKQPAMAMAWKRIKHSEQLLQQIIKKIQYFLHNTKYYHLECLSKPHFVCNETPATSP